MLSSDEESPSVDGFFNYSCSPFVGAVTGFGSDPNQRWFVAALRSLQRRL